MVLSQDEIKRLSLPSRDGWSCDDFPSEYCSEDGHSNNLMIVTQREDLSFSGNAVKLHVGDVFSPTSETSIVSSLFAGDHGLFNSRTESDDQPSNRHPPTDGVVQIPPGRFVYFLTEEIINLPFNVSGKLFMNPTISNSGLLFFTAGHVAPGWRGRLTGTFLNMTDQTVYLNRKQNVLYLSFSQTAPYPEDGNDSRHFSKYRRHEDPQLTIEDARDGDLIHPDPGFALSTQFVTKQDLYQLLIIGLSALTILVSVFLFIFRGGVGG